MFKLEIPESLWSLCSFLTGRSRRPPAPPAPEPVTPGERAGVALLTAAAASHAATEIRSRAVAGKAAAAAALLTGSKAADVLQLVNDSRQREQWAEIGAAGADVSLTGSK